MSKFYSNNSNILMKFYINNAYKKEWKNLYKQY